MRVVRFMAFVSLSSLSGLAFGQKKIDVTQQGLQAPPLAMIEDAEGQLGEGHLDESGKDLRSAASLMRVEASVYAEGDRATLAGLSKRLDDLAGRVSAGSVKTKAALDQELVGIALTKANFHLSQAGKEWAAKDAKRTGYELLSAAHAVDHGLQWKGGQVPAASKQRVSTALAVAGRLIDGATVSPTEVDGARQGLAAEVQRVSH